MTLCWAANAEDRPTFKEIVPMFDSILKPKNKQQRYSELPESASSNRPRAVERSKTENKYVRNWDTGHVKPQPRTRKHKSSSRTRLVFKFFDNNHKNYRLVNESASLDRRDHSRSSNYTTLRSSPGQHQSNTMRSQHR